MTDQQPAEQLERLLASLDARTPLRDSAPALDEAVVIADDDPQLLRYVAFHASRVGAVERARALLSEIPPFVRTGEDATQLGLCLLELGRYDEGHRELDAIDRDELLPWEEVFYLANWAVAQVIDRSAATALDASAFEAALARFDVLIRSPEVARHMSRDWREQYAAVVLEARGLRALHEGRTGDAVALLHEAHETSTANPWIALAYGDALTGANDTEAATAMWRKCVDLAHPESHLAGLARDRLTAEYR